MITLEELMSIDNSDIQEASKSISKDDIVQLVEWLSQKDDKIRYKALLMLQNRSLHYDDVYPFWNIFQEKLKSENSYQRSIGLMLVAENVKWDTENRINESIEDYLSILKDEKPITIRQCIQSLNKIVPYKMDLHCKITDKIMNIDILSLKETMRKLILLDILDVLLAIRKYKTSDEIEGYILNALSGELLDKKAKKYIQSNL